MLIQDLHLIREEKWKTEKELRNTEDKLRLANETIQKMEQQIETINEKMKRVVEEKGQIELELADIIDEHNMKKQEARQATRSKRNKIKKYALQKEMCLQYAFSAIVILVAVIIAMSGFFKCGH